MTFNVGEKVVYPNHGVGTIENISTRSFGATNERFYLLRLNYNSMTVMVPFSHVGDVGLRKITKTGEITRVLNFLAAGVSSTAADWKVRFKVNSDKMRNGSLPEIAEVFKSLLIIQSDKPLIVPGEEDARPGTPYARNRGIDLPCGLRRRTQLICFRKPSENPPSVCLPPLSFPPVLAYVS